MKTELTIRNCDKIFRFQCPKLWDELSPTESAKVRHCSTCNLDVHFCKTDEETIEHARAGHCIAREIPALSECATVFIGQPREDSVPTSAQVEASGWRNRESAIDDSIHNADSVRACPACGYPAPVWRVACRVCGCDFGRFVK